MLRSLHLSRVLVVPFALAFAAGTCARGDIDGPLEPRAATP
jgi:hypothetical protein